MLLQNYRLELQSGLRPVALLFCDRYDGGKVRYDIKNSKHLPVIEKVDHDFEGYYCWVYRNGRYSDPFYFEEEQCLKF